MTTTLLHPDGRPLTVDELAQLNEAATSHQNMRKRLWCEVAASYCTGSTTIRTEAMIVAADCALAAFDNRFSPQGNKL